MNNELIELFEPLFKVMAQTENNLHHLMRNCDAISELFKKDNTYFTTEWFNLKKDIMVLQKTFSSLISDIRTEILNFDYQIQSYNHDIDVEMNDVLTYLDNFEKNISDLLK